MKILVGYDGTNASKEAINLSIMHAKAFGAEIHVATSMESGTEKQQQEIVNAKNELDWVESTFVKEKIPCECHLLIRGLSPGEDLVQFAEENRVDEIIVGVKRRSRVEKILLGSTAQYVIIKAPCVVVTVK